MQRILSLSYEKTGQHRKLKLMLTRRAKAYSSSRSR